MKSLRREEESAELYGSTWARLEKDLQAARKRSMDRAKTDREKIANIRNVAKNEKSSMVEKLDKLFGLLTPNHEPVLWTLRPSGKDSFTFGVPFPEGSPLLQALLQRAGADGDDGNIRKAPRSSGQTRGQNFVQNRCRLVRAREAGEKFPKGFGSRICACEQAGFCVQHEAGSRHLVAVKQTLLSAALKQAGACQLEGGERGDESDDAFLGCRR